MDDLARIAAALERLAPAPPAGADPLAHPAYVWRQNVLVAARAFAPLSLDLLHGVEAQKDALLTNLERLAAGHAAQDVLLWGARGTGKSALVKSVVGAVQGAGTQLAIGGVERALVGAVFDTATQVVVGRVRLEHYRRTAA